MILSIHNTTGSDIGRVTISDVMGTDIMVLESVEKNQSYSVMQSTLTENILIVSDNRTFRFACHYDSDPLEINITDDGIIVNGEKMVNLVVDGKGSKLPIMMIIIIVIIILIFMASKKMKKRS
jgi:hypothetical protein